MASESRLSRVATEAWASSTRAQQSPALVFSEDLSTELGTLTSQRCKAALPFAGKYRVIDFTLSNCVNSGIDTVGVLTQYQPRSLHSHLAYGRPWDLDRSAGGLTILHPYQGRSGMRWYSGTADAVYQNQEFLYRCHTDQVFLLSGCEVFGMDLSVLAAQHRESKADLTIGAVSSSDPVSSCHYTLVADDDGWVRELLPPEGGSSGSFRMMGVFLCATDMLGWRLAEDARQAHSTHDLIRDVIAHMIRDGDRVMVSHHTGYWNSVPTVYHYWRAHMDLLEDSPVLNLQDVSWPIRTQYQIRPPTRVARGARVSHSLLSEGCIVEGTVEYSVLSPGVYIGPGAVVRNSVVMHDVTIEERSVVENAIVDMEVIVGPQARVGPAERHVPTLGQAKPVKLTVVPQSTHISAHQVFEPDPATECYPSAYRDYAPGNRVTTT